MTDIIHRIGIKAPLSRVYAAISTVEGVAGWWTNETTGDSKQGGIIEVVFRSKAGQEIGSMSFELARLDPRGEVEWRFVAGPDEWLPTRATFKLTQEGDYTIVIFAHRDWREAVEFTAHCSTKWAVFLLSLKQLVETGQGAPSPDDVKIDNWN